LATFSSPQQAQTPDDRPLPPWAVAIEAKYLGMKARIDVPSYRIGDSSISGVGLLPWKLPVDGTLEPSNRILAKEYTDATARLSLCFLTRVAQHPFCN
jgi:hypothetical protein